MNKFQLGLRTISSNSRSLNYILFYCLLSPVLSHCAKPFFNAHPFRDLDLFPVPETSVNESPFPPLSSLSLLIFPHQNLNSFIIKLLPVLKKTFCESLHLPVSPCYFQSIHQTSACMCLLSAFLKPIAMLISSQLLH